jgi:hypothetical protein
MATIGLLASCSSSSEPLQAEFISALGPETAAAVSGAAVDEGVVCADGTLNRVRMEDTEGAIVSDEEGAVLWDEALESGATLEMVLYEEFNCSDGSGSFVIVVDNVVQPSTLDFEGSNDVGSWTIDGGTGSYESRTGEGDYVVDFGGAEIHYPGELAEG